MIIKAYKDIFNGKKYKILTILLFIYIHLYVFNNLTIIQYERNFKFCRENYTDRIPILTFHRLVPEDIKNKEYINDQYIGSIEKFAEMMEWLYTNDYKTINTTEFYLWYKGKIEYKPKTVLITIDDGFYDIYYLVYPIIKKYNFKITSFIVGSRIKKKTPKYNKNKIGFIGEDIIDKIKKEYPNIEFQSHSYNMHYRTKNNQIRILSMNFEELKLDVLSNSKFGFTTMAYPYGKYNIDIKSILKEQRYLCAFSFLPNDYATRKSDRYAIPRIKINGFANKYDMIKWVK